MLNIEIPTLPETYLAIPAFPSNHILRPALTSELLIRPQTRIISLEAGSGYGKTQAALEFALNFSGAIVWFRVSYLPVRSGLCFLWNFYRAVVYAIPKFDDNAIMERFRVANEISDTNAQRTILQSITNLLKTKLEQLELSICIIVDDLQAMMPDVDVHAVLETLVDCVSTLSPALWVFTSHQPIQFEQRNHWISGGQLWVIDEAKLALSEQECVSKITRMGAICDLKRREVLQQTRYHQPYYCHLLGLNWRNLNETEADIGEIVQTNAANTEFLMRQTQKLLLQETSDVQLFLCKTSVLPELNIKQCGILCDVSFAEACIRQTKNSEFFIRERHDLTRQTLTQEYAQRFGQSEVTAAYTSLGTWYAENEQYEQALRAYVKADNGAMAKSLLRQRAIAVSDQINYAELQQLLRVVPENWHKTDPVTIVCVGILEGIKPESRAYALILFKNAQTLAKQNHDEQTTFWAFLEECHWLWQEDRYIAAQELMPALLQNLPGHLLSRWYRIYAEILQGSDQFDEALRISETGIKLCEKLGDRYGIVRLMIQQGWVLKTQGDYQAAVAIAELALELAEKWGLGNMAMAQIHYQLSWSRVEMGHEAKTESHLLAIDHVLQKFEHAGYLPYMKTYVLYRWVDFYMLRYDYDLADKVFAKTGIDLNTDHYGWSKLLLERAEIDLNALKQFQQVLQIAQQHHIKSPDGSLLQFCELDFLFVAGNVLTQDYASAEKRLSHICELCKKYQLNWHLASAQMLLAGVYLRQSKWSQTRGLLITALAYMLLHDCLNLFIWLPKLMAELCAFAIDQDIQPIFSERWAHKRFITQHAQPFLGLLNHKNTQVRTAAERVLDHMGLGVTLQAQTWLNEKCKDVQIRDRLNQWLKEGWLTSTGLLQLAQALSPREIEVFLLWLHPLHKGSLVSVAAEPGRNENTLKTQMKKVREKLKDQYPQIAALDYPEALAWVRQNKIVMH